MSLEDDFQTKSESRQEEVYLRFLDDLQLYANRERSVKFYADKLCISPKHFSRLVRKASGKLPMEHIQQRVIIEAKTLLCSTDMTIHEIADALNFPTDSFFCRYFKHETGCSPSDYRYLSVHFDKGTELAWIIRTFAPSLLIEIMDDRDYIAELVRATYKELSAPRQKTKHDK